MHIGADRIFTTAQWCFALGSETSIRVPCFFVFMVAFIICGKFPFIINKYKYLYDYGGEFLPVKIPLGFRDYPGRKSIVRSLPEQIWFYFDK